MHKLYLALGSNVGDRAANLKAAIDAVKPEVIATICSPVYETPPWGYLDQPQFLNQVIEAQTTLPPGELLVHLKRTEELLGRKKTFKNGPRIIDLDIIFYDDVVINSPPLVIPHAHMQDRAFVLIPLNAIAPNFCHPIFKKRVSELLKKVDQSGITEVSSPGCDGKLN
jgi:2-amino-4-hydroxy-6-hydroxymethyldihydropteridine diphosphokinase